MGQFKGTFDGGVVAEPEVKQFASGASVLEFPVYVNDEDKNKDTGKYERNDTVTKIRVKVWSSNPIFEEVAAAVKKGVIVEVTGTVVEREWEGKNGAGRGLETKWVESVTVKWAPDAVGATPRASSGFGDDVPIPSGFN